MPSVQHAVVVLMHYVILTPTLSSLATSVGSMEHGYKEPTAYMEEDMPATAACLRYMHSWCP